MFLKCVFPDNFYLPDCFVCDEADQTYKMFEYASLPENHDHTKFNDEKSIVEWLKCRSERVTELTTFG